jgi:hypothetical protein
MDHHGLSQKENAVAIKENGCSYQRKCRFSHEEEEHR